MRQKNLYLLTLTFFLLSAFSSKDKPLSDEIIRLKIVGMADLHGNFLDYDYIRKRPSVGGLPYVYAYLMQERKDTNQHLIFLNAGDILQGSMAAYYYNYRDQRNFYMPAVFLNKAGLDASVVGNHDLEIGLPILNRFIQELDSDVLAANVVYTETNELFLKPYTILDRSGLRIAVLALTMPILSGCVAIQLTEELEVLNMFGPAQYWMKHIQEEEKPDLTIGLFHAGYCCSTEADSVPTLENCFRLNDSKYIAEQIPGFDAIILAHLHKLVLSRIADVAGDSVWMIEPGYGGRDIAVLDFEIQKIPGQKAKILNSSAEIVNVFETQKTSSTDIAEFTTEKEIMRAVADEKIAVLTDTIRIVEAFFGSNFFVDLVHKVQLERTGADVSFASPLSSNVVIPAGPVMFPDLLRLYRRLIFTDNIRLSFLSGRSI
jgi:2',3'-cyclic-nucleotide 2'-phosphodiesterase/3'-nucleotidase